MPRTDRLFELIQLLRSSRTTRTAASLADELEVSVRTVYRDISLLQSLRVPVEGEAGIGYMMRNGYDLPPLMFNASELEAIRFGLAMIGQRGDQAMHKSALSAMRKIENVLPDSIGNLIPPGTVHFVQGHASNAHLEAVRAAIRNPHYIELVYEAADGTVSQRTIMPLALIFFAQATIAAAWCEMREDFRHFRVDRMLSVKQGDPVPETVSRKSLADWKAVETPHLEDHCVVPIEEIFATGERRIA
ncbi:MAG: YafY family protein [Pseudomonadota bacterium]